MTRDPNWEGREGMVYETTILLSIKYPINGLYILVFPVCDPIVGVCNYGVVCGADLPTLDSHNGQLRMFE